MKTILTFVLALLTVSVLAIPDAEAKRMGGGSNLGRQTTMPKQAQAPAAAPTQAQRPGAAAPAASGASRWLGPLAGLAAGGLLAAMFFGGAFEGMAAMDWMLIAAMAIGAFFLFRALRRRAATGPIPAMGRMGPAGVPAGAPQAPRRAPRAMGPGPASSRGRPLLPRHPPRARPRPGSTAPGSPRVPSPTTSASRPPGTRPTGPTSAPTRPPPCSPSSRPSTAGLPPRASTPRSSPSMPNCSRCSATGIWCWPACASRV